ncbi:Metalloreductase STEAP3 [Basidiobolus ranarum]|uniref:Metalloreductase STEAP3 n=1 Tax=Basidiobolus ranarum TaxID=34480 RepID=A0ABR2VLX6_9FUNG
MPESSVHISSFVDMDEKPTLITTSDLGRSALKIGIIGTGWYGRALAKRLTESGFDVILGSRDPSSVEFELPCRAATYYEVITSCSTLALTIPWVHHKAFAREHELALIDKIIIDVSNPNNLSELLQGDLCIAERLQDYLPKSKIVKGFNTISAYTLQHDVRGSNRQVHICTDSSEAYDLMSYIVKEIG